MKNGNIEIEHGLIINNSFSTNDFEQLKKNDTVEYLIENGDYKSYKTEPILYLGIKIIISLYFKINKITHVNLYFLEPRVDGWSLDTELVELEKKSLQDKWLSYVLEENPPYQYPWGTIDSYYDLKSGFSSITITY